MPHDRSTSAPVAAPGSTRAAGKPPPAPFSKTRAIGSFVLWLLTLWLAAASGPAWLLVHAFSAIACVVLAPSKNRSRYVWFHAGLVFGVFALDRLSRRPARETPRAGTVELGIAYAGVLDFMVLCGMAQGIVEDRIIPSGRLGNPMIVVLMSLFVASFGALIFINRSALYRYMTNVKTSVTLVTYLGLSSLAMTLILQQPDAEKAWLGDRELAGDARDAKTGRPLSNVDKEYVKFMAAETGLVYGFRHIFDGPPPATAGEKALEERLRVAFGDTQGHNIATRNADDRERRRKRLEKQATADDTGDGLRGFFELCRTTRLYEIRRSWWLVVGVLDLLAVSLVLVCVDRWRKKSKRYAFYFAHAGLVLVITGRHFTDNDQTFLQYLAGQSRRGNLELCQGRPDDRALDDFLQPSWRLPFRVRLEKFEVDFYKQWEIRIPDARFDVLANTYLPRQGKKLELHDADGALWTLDAAEHHLVVDLERRIEDDPAGPWAGSLLGTVRIPKAPNAPARSVALVGGVEEISDAHLGMTSLDRPGDDLYLRAVIAPDDAAFARETERVLSMEEPPFGVLEVATGDGKRFELVIPIAGGLVRRDVVGVGRIAFDAQFLAKNWHQDQNPKEEGGPVPLWAQDEAAQLLEGRFAFAKTESDTPKTLRIAVFPSSFVAESDASAAGFAGWSFRLRRIPAPVFGSPAIKIVLGPSGKAALVVPEGEGGSVARAVPLVVGADVPIGETGAVLHVDALHGRSAPRTKIVPKDDKARSVVDDDLGTAPHDYVSASRFHVTPPAGFAAPDDVWVTSADRWPQRFGRSNEMTLTLSELSQARDFRSYVTILEGGTATPSDGAPPEEFGVGCGQRGPAPTLTGATVTVDHHLIQVNGPLWYRGYKLYQSRFHKSEPGFSGLIVKRDRGLPWIYVGLPLTFTGILWMLIVDPALARRRAGKRDEELLRLAEKRGSRA